VTGLAFMPANPGAVEINGMSDHGANDGHPDQALLLGPPDAFPAGRRGMHGRR
jgi:hypothetical protein